MTEKHKKNKTIICLVIHSLQAGGMERVMSELAWYFAAKKEVELHLILYGVNREIFYEIPKNITIHKPPFVFNNKWRLISTFKTIFYLRKTLKKINPQSILSFGEYWNSFLLLSIFGLKLPAFVSDRSQPDKSLGRLNDTLRHWLYPTAKGLILQTEKAKKIYLQKNKQKNIAVIGNPIRNFDGFESPEKKEKSVLMVGRLIKSKHQDQLIEIFAKVSPPDWKLILVGYDHLKQQNMDRLKALARDLNIDQRVEFMGKMDNVEEIYLNSSIFAFTSSSEGFPNVIGEAMAAGLPVIAYDCVAGPSEMISDGYNGFLIPLFDKTLFESKLAVLMNDQTLREMLGSNGQLSIKKFSRDKICEDFYNFILE